MSRPQPPPQRPRPSAPRVRNEPIVKLVDYLRARAKPLRRVLVAVSGGPDSSALLHALAAVAVELELTLIVATVDHGLRAASAVECAGVVTLAASLKLPVEVLRLQLPKPTLASAREARYAALIACAQRHDAAAIAIGHTVDDQLETFLDHVIRGSGLRGLAGMPIERPLTPTIALIRPLLGARISRHVVLAYIAQHGLTPAIDPSNANLQRRRSRLRHEVVPLLERERPQLAYAVAMLCERLRSDEELLATLAAPLDASDRRALVDAPAPLVVRALERVVGAPLWAEQHRQISALLASTDGTSELRLDANRRLVRTYDAITIEPNLPTELPALPPITHAGEYLLDGEVVTIDAAQLARLADHAPQFRRRAPGDRLRWRGHERKLSDLFINHKVPRPARLTAIILDAATGYNRTRQIHAVFVFGDRGATLPRVLLADAT